MIGEGPATVQTHADLHMSGSAEVRIAVAPPVAYAAVTDLARMGVWSPENQGGEWLDGTPGTVGATFLGRNQRGGGSWETVATVIEARSPSRYGGASEKDDRAAFAFRVATPGEEHGTEWRFEFRPDADGTVVTESFAWHWTPLPDEGFRARVGRMPLDDAVREVAERERHLQESIETTTANLKHSLERV